MLPASLLMAVEAHGCFSGCYDYHTDVMVALDPHQPAERALQVQCEDCLSFHVGVLVKLLPAGLSSTQLARDLSDHLRVLRGYEWAVGGYHGGPGSLWLSAAYYSCGVFLINGERDSRRATDLDCLIDGFKHHVIRPSDPRMLQAQSYRVQRVYLDMSKPIVPVRSVQDILSSPQCSPMYKPGYDSVTVAEFLPLTRATQPPVQPTLQATAQARQATATAQATAQAARPAAPVTAPSTRALRLGDRCPVCGELVKERPSLLDTFIGCMC
jgi:hypothetical protein